MGDILIKGMEMPESCVECRLCEGDTMDGFCHAVSKWFDDEYFRWYQYEEDDIDESKPANCPLVEVPTPHGRLIDEDLLIADIRENSASYFADDFAHEWTSKQPTVIEASEEEK